MKVKEAIEQLQKCDPEAIITISTTFEEFNPVEIVSDKNNSWQVFIVASYGN